jgi:hypothetical protein
MTQEFLRRTDDRTRRAARESLTVARSTGDVEGLGVGLALLASLAMRRAESEVAARLLGAAHEMIAQAGVALDGYEAKLFETTREELHRAIAHEEYEAAFTEGNAMSADEAVEYALASLRSPGLSFMTSPRAACTDLAAGRGREGSGAAACPRASDQLGVVHALRS